MADKTSGGNGDGSTGEKAQGTNGGLAESVDVKAALSQKITRISTGIPGLDEMLEGGIPKNRHVAVFGGPGTGKTTFSIQYLYAGAKAGETGLYLSLEEPPEQIITNAVNVFSDLKDLPEFFEGKILVKKPEAYNLDNVIEVIENAVVNQNATRVVVDSSTVVEAMFSNDYDYRKSIVEFLNLLKTLDTTVYFLVEASNAEIDIRYKLEHYIMDGIINLYNLQRGNSRVRALEIYKMRATNHSQKLVAMKITPQGIKVYPSEGVL